MKVLDTVLAVGATLRLTRFITSDHLGEWWLVSPAKRWAMKHEGEGHEWQTLQYSDGAEVPVKGAGTSQPDPENGWRSKLVSGLDCPFCVGFWIGALALVAAVVLPRVPVLRMLWRLGAGALSLNYLTGHIGSRLDG